MLIICNGAIKSGSTWLYNILIHLVSCQHPPEKYLTGRTPKSPCIRPEMLSAFLYEQDIESKNFISKNHLSRESHRQLLAGNNQVYVFDIERDARDVVVSNYYHDCFRNGYEGSFGDYYWSNGRYVAAELSSYHQLWRSGSPRFYVSSYERLHSEFGQEVRRIAETLGIRLSEEDVAQLKKDTSIDTLREKYKTEDRYQGKKFFRKGKIGDWENHFDERMLRDITGIQEHGLGRYDWRNAIRKLTTGAK